MTNVPEYISPVARAAAGLLGTALRGVAPPPSAEGRQQDLSPLLAAIARALRSPATRPDHPSTQARRASGADPGPIGGPRASARPPSPPADAPTVAGPRALGPVAQPSLPSRGSGSPAYAQDHGPTRPGTSAPAPLRPGKATSALTRAAGSRPDALAVGPLQVPRADLPPPNGSLAREPRPEWPLPSVELPARPQAASPGPAASVGAPVPAPSPRGGGGDLPPVLRAPTGRRLEVDVIVRAATDGLAAALAESDEVREAVCRILREAVGDEA